MNHLPENITANQYIENQGNQLFPVFIKLNQLHTVLIGAGNVGLEKLTALLNNSPQATITVISREVSSEVQTLASRYTKVDVKNKTFEETDLDNADIVVAATNNNDLNNYIQRAAHERKLLVNIADKPELCDFYLGSVVQKGDLKIAISTNGKSPTIAKRIKDFLNNEIPDEIDGTLQNINLLRNSLSGDFAAKVKELNKITSILATGKTDAEKKKTSAFIDISSKIIAVVAIVMAIINIKTIADFFISVFNRL